MAGAGVVSQTENNMNDIFSVLPILTFIIQFYSILFYSILYTLVGFAQRHESEWMVRGGFVVYRGVYGQLYWENPDQMYVL